MHTIAIIMMLTAVGADESVNPADIEFFEKKVRPILVERCFECHATAAKGPKGGLVLDRRESILTGGDSGSAVNAKEPEASLIVEAIKYDSQQIQMPPSGKIPDAEIETLKEWIRRGVPFPPGGMGEVKRQTINLEEGRKHWAFVPAKSHELPVLNGFTPGTRTDSFLQQRRIEKQITPSEPADRVTLMRRASFDLLGLPPSMDDLASFESDSAPDAFDRLVDRYLASPQYGERWGRTWLDLVRYCDIPESWREGDARAYLYRDWVIRSWNDDLPYDQFVRQQLAADLLPGATPADQVAVGFLGLSPTYWKELKLDHNVIKQVVAEEWEERIEALGATFLGLSLACARCHDHKFDPISMHDYYGIAGVMASTKLEDRAIIPDEFAVPARDARKKVAEAQKQLEELKKKKEPTDEDKAKLAELPGQIDEWKRTPHYDTPLAYGVTEASIVVSPDGENRTKIDYEVGKPIDVAMHVRGNAAKTGEVIPRHYLSLFSSSAERRFQRGSGRLELADAIVTESSSLAARVFVNRIWLQHFGRGLVTTPSNFGTQGERPSHPKLLDDLVVRFQQAGWSPKWLHRELMLSATYQQSSQRTPEKHLLDPDNVTLWRMKPRRLDVEAWRDRMLVATGELNLVLGGEATDLADVNNRRRTVYGRIKRRELSDVLRLYDFPDPVSHVPNRDPTITPLQLLFVLNNSLLQERSRVLAAQASQPAELRDDERIVMLYREAFARTPTADEIKLGVAFLDQSRSAGTTNEECWREFCQALLGSNEFQFVD